MIYASIALVVIAFVFALYGTWESLIRERDIKKQISDYDDTENFY